ncbi:MAG: EI24 domain-containing protein [Alphaproteobacteria bacterium]|nr:EI24 domain-containing protein [Alphaproteobacteria bacterium]
MPTAFLRAITQLTEPSLRRLLMASLAIAFATFVVLLGALWLALPWLAGLLPAATPHWLRVAVEFVAGAGAVVLSIILFPAVVTTIQTTLLVERVCGAVEARHYPGLPPPRSPGVAEQVVISLRFLGTAIGLNLVALPLYFVPVVNAVLFVVLNGYLLARENFDAIAPRRVAWPAQRALWKTSRLRFWVAGGLFALLMAIPFVNLAAAILAAATMTHLVEASRREAGATSSPR